MAKDFLSISPSSARIESIFSNCKKLIPDQRNRLLPSTTKDLILGYNWIHYDQ